MLGLRWYEVDTHIEKTMADGKENGDIFNELVILLFQSSRNSPFTSMANHPVLLKTSCSNYPRRPGMPRAFVRIQYLEFQ